MTAADMPRKKIARLKVFALDRDNTLPRGLLVCITGHDNTASADQHLREARAVKTKTGTASPQVRNPEETLGQFDGFGDRQRLRIRDDVARLDPFVALVR